MTKCIKDASSSQGVLSSFAYPFSFASNGMITGINAKGIDVGKRAECEVTGGKDESGDKESKASKVPDRGSLVDGGEWLK